MLEYQSVDVGADILFIALPGLRCWIQNEEHAASNLCRCRCTRKRTPSTTSAKWPGMPKPCHILFVEKNSSISFNGDHDSSKADFPQILESLSHPTSSSLFIHLEHINVVIFLPLTSWFRWPWSPATPLLWRQSRSAATFRRAVPCCTPFWLESPQLQEIYRKQPTNKSPFEGDQNKYNCTTNFIVIVNGSKRLQLSVLYQITLVCSCDIPSNSSLCVIW